MSNFQVLFFSLVLMVVSLSVVKADEIQTVADQSDTESINDDAGVDRSADSKSLFEGRCQMCHQLPEPTMLKPKQWKLILGTMQQRMQQAGVPPLTEDETEMVLEYIAQQSR